MKKPPLFKCLLITVLLLSSCNKDDDNNADCVKDNYFKAQFDGGVIEPKWHTGGGFGRYSLSFSRCFENEDNWKLTINTINDLGFYLSFIGINGIGTYTIKSGNPDHIAIDCAEKTSLYIIDQKTGYYTYLSTSNGTIEITEYDSGLGILIGTFTSEMVSTTDPTVKKTITGEFNLNKSTLDKTKKPCWL